MKPTAPRHAAWLLGVAALLAGVLWHWAREAPESPGAPAEAPVPVAALPLPQPVALPGGAGASAASAPRALPRPDGADEGLEVCGGGRVPAEQVRLWRANPDLGRAWLDQQMQGLEARTQAAVAEVAARLAAGPVRQQVAARLLMGDADGAASLAVLGSDVGAYQLATAGCVGRGLAQGGAGCGALSPQRWAALDSSDARPWLLVLSQAQQAKDTLAVEEALAALAGRPRLSRRFHLLTSEVLQGLPPAMEPATRAQVLIVAMGIQAAWADAGMASLRRACGGEARRPTARFAVCQTVARQMLAASSDFMEATLAQKMADDLSVSKRDQAFTAEALAAAWATFLEVAHARPGADMSCRSLQAQGDLTVQLAREGELPYAMAQWRARQAR